MWGQVCLKIREGSSVDVHLLVWKRVCNFSLFKLQEILLDLRRTGLGSNYKHLCTGLWTKTWAHVTHMTQSWGQSGQDWPGETKLFLIR